MSLAICDACHRHVASAARRCPFCQVVRSPTASGRRPRFEGPRGTILAVGLATAALAGCDETDDKSRDDDQHQVGEDGGDVTNACDAGSVDPDPVDAGEVDASEWVPTPIYEAIPPRR